jgi:ADP-ribose pyrophosphatase YjhB (NUDIX family)
VPGLRVRRVHVRADRREHDRRTRGGRAPRSPELVENDETIEEAARRETTEETGFTVALDGLLATWMRPGFPILVVIYRAHITAGTLRVAPDEASEAAFFPKDQLPPLEDLAWPSTVHGLDAWRAYEPTRP